MDGHVSTWRLAILAAAVTLWIGGCAASQTASMAFGTGGTDCELASTASTFAPGVTVRMVATIEPLPASVTISTRRDGDLIQGPETIELDGSVPCVYGSLPDLGAGRYQVVVEIPESQLPPLEGGFDVTP